MDNTYQKLLLTIKSSKNHEKICEMIDQLDDVCKSHLIVDLFSIEYLDVLGCLVNQDILLKIDQQKISI